MFKATFNPTVMPFLSLIETSKHEFVAVFILVEFAVDFSIFGPYFFLYFSVPSGIPGYSVQVCQIPV